MLSEMFPDHPNLHSTWEVTDRLKKTGYVAKPAGGNIVSLLLSLKWLNLQMEDSKMAAHVHFCHQVAQFYYGLQYQCVDFAQHWLIHATRVTYGLIW